MPDAAAASDAILSTRTCAGSRGQEIHKKGGKNKNKFLSTIRALSRQIKEFLFFSGMFCSNRARVPNSSRPLTSVSVCMYVCMHVCVCVSVSE